jgi:hypothetical protein
MSIIQIEQISIDIIAKGVFMRKYRGVMIVHRAYRGKILRRGLILKLENYSITTFSFFMRQRWMRFEVNISNNKKKEKWQRSTLINYLNDKNKKIIKAKADIEIETPIDISIKKVGIKKDNKIEASNV